MVNIIGFPVIYYSVGARSKEKTNLPGKIKLIVQRKFQWHHGHLMIPEGSICHITKLTKEAKMEQMG